MRDPAAKQSLQDMTSSASMPSLFDRPRRQNWYHELRHCAALQSNFMQFLYKLTLTAPIPVTAACSTALLAEYMATSTWDLHAQHANLCRKATRLILLPCSNCSADFARSFFLTFTLQQRFQGQACRRKLRQARMQRRYF